MESIQILLTELIDYAGLFPPAALEMNPAVCNFSGYVQSEYAWMLGRFVVPMSRLEELEHEAGDLLPRGNPVYPWKISVLAGKDLLADVESIAAFNYYHATDVNAGAGVIDTIEIRVETADAIFHAMKVLPRTLAAYFEIPLSAPYSDLLAAIAHTGARAKVRTGGVVAQAFPPMNDLAKFIVHCANEKIPFKATAGLHHPLRGIYSMTYEENSESALMHGFLNVFLAAAFARFGMRLEDVRILLEEHKPQAFQFTNEGVTWRGHELSLQRLAVARQQFSIAYGSCSFEEPIADLKKLGLL
jgi:hypothetical protein